MPQRRSGSGKLRSSKRQQNALTSAIKEYGALRRTVYANRYLADETYRRRISRQLNKGGNLHALRRGLAYAVEGAGDRLAPRDGLIIGLLMVSASVVLLNEMLLGMALPTLISDLGITPSAAQWVTTGYLLTMAVLIPATGFIMRRYQLRTISLTAMSLFTVGTVLGALAPGIELLLAGRIIQAAGTAVFVPLLITTTMRLAPDGRREQLMALATAIPGIAPAFGPALAGVVLSQLSWR